MTIVDDRAPAVTSIATSPAEPVGGGGGAPHLSVVIPAYNEERRIVPTLRRVLAYFAQRPYRTELVVVSDGSTDGTEWVVREAFAGLPPDGPVAASFHEYRPNAGKGKAVREGVRRTRGRFVAFTDADLSTPVEEIDRALEHLQSGRYQVVIGSRAAAGADVARKQPLYRRVSARFFNVLRDRIAGIRGLHDTQCGLKVFDGDVARAVFGQQRIDGFMFDVETMFIAQRLGLGIFEMGVRWEDAPDSRVRLVSGFRLLPDLTRIRLLHRHLTPADRATLVAAARPQEAR